MIKKIIFIVTFVALITAFASGTALADDAYYFEIFDVEVVVGSDYTFKIVEEITVNFNEERHGIYRSISNYWGDDRIKYKDIKVEGAPFKIEKSNYDTNIRIGDADKYVIGTQHYTISYTILLPKDSNTDMDAIYMNVMGYEHPVFTMNSTIKVKLPKSVDPSYIAVLSGYYYDSGISDKLSYDYLDRKELYIKTLLPLDPHEGITVKIDLPEGYFQNVKTPFFFDDFLKSFLPLLYIILGILIWAIFGRDEIIVMPVEVSAPDVSPVEAGFIIDGVVDGDDIAAMIIYWASLGLIKIEETDKKRQYNFYKLKEISNCPGYEKTLFNQLFKMDDDTEYISTSTIKSRLASKSLSFKKKVKKKYEKGKTRLLNEKSVNLSHLVMLFAYLCFNTIGFFFGLSQSFATAVMAAIFFTIPFTFMQLWLKHILTYTRKRRLGKNIIKFIVYFVLLFVVWLVVSSIGMETALTVEQTSIMLFGSVFLIILSHYTQKLTLKGHEQYERVLGFRHFMLTAEKEWLETLANDDPEFFYDKLPYALVLGVSKVWIGKFAKLITTPPSWYVGDAASFNARTFSSRLASDFTHIGASALPKSSSSGGSYRSSSSSFSSGGGFSGGGFSGGGSSSW